uniref:ATP synthase subunit a n=2 Tax=Thoradonta TaxID=510020 RepID=A0A343QNR0_9ORTH|nr:ATP synthase F0 subunit 6 [Thoradonta obtusilobata]QPK42116.1 ATP synthase F0 subunit 6 [Thoradonta nodulosa]
MMTNLFSSFDPSTSSSTAANWLSTMIFIIILPTSYWLMNSRCQMLSNSILIKLNSEFSVIMNNNNKKSTIVFISIFTLMLINNFMGLFPYIFTSTSHMVMTLSIALPTWLSFNLYGWINKTNHMFEHLVPLGTPGILMPFMVCIESISNMIRPGTLAIRLAANMIAGHLLLTLLGNMGSKIHELLLIPMLSIQTLLFILEMAVSIIQAYVFSILTTLYSSEIN